MELCKQFGGDRTEKWFGFPTLINQVEESGDKNAEISTCLAMAMMVANDGWVTWLDRPKGRQREVGARRAPRLHVLFIFDVMGWR